MHHVVQRISVPFEYPVYFTAEGLFAAANADFASVLKAKEPARAHRFLVVVDDGVAKTWPKLGSDIAAYAAKHGLVHVDTIVVPGGEASKNDPELVTSLLAALDRHAIDRQSYVVVIGGGAVLDMAGYAAAIAHRGVRCVRVPTTVLSQADSGVGVKNGVNMFGKKNFAGTFVPPFAVMIDTEFLSTLPRRDALAGMAEAVKVSLIRDAAFFEWIEANAEKLAACSPAELGHLVRRCAELHLQHIATSGDPFEYGSARPLDFGHWSAHKLETLTKHDVRHGEAVAIGMALDTLYTVARGMCSAETGDRIVKTLRRLGLPLWHDALEWEVEGRRRVMAGLSEFREHLGGELTVTLVRSPGDSVEVHEMDEALVLGAIGTLKTLR